MAYDVIGDIAILKFKGESKKEKKRIAEKLLRQKNVKTVLEKIEKVKGRLRTIKTKYLAGIKTRETIHKENNCLFKLDVEKCYFSPRLSNERLEIARKIKKQDKVLVLFAGVAPFSIVIAKLAKASVVSVELGREASKYAEENVKLNKINNIKIIQGDVKKLKKLLRREKIKKFNCIVMPRPQLKETFLKYIWEFCKKGTRIYYYAFGKNVEEIIEKIKNEANKARKKIKILKVKKAGELAPYKFRWRVDLYMGCVRK